jgi:hypothetical protein
MASFFSAILDLLAYSRNSSVTQTLFDSSREVVIVTDYPIANGRTIHVIFGDTESIKDDLMTLNGWEGVKDLVKYHPWPLAMGSMGKGWVILDEERLNEVTNKFDEICISYLILTFEEYTAREERVSEINHQPSVVL